MSRSAQGSSACPHPPCASAHPRRCSSFLGFAVARVTGIQDAEKRRFPLAARCSIEPTLGAHLPCSHWSRSARHNPPILRPHFRVCKALILQRYYSSFYAQPHRRPLARYSCLALPVEPEPGKRLSGAPTGLPFIRQPSPLAALSMMMRSSAAVYARRWSRLGGR
jgi:hypothetical protein